MNNSRIIPIFFIVIIFALAGFTGYLYIRNNELTSEKTKLEYELSLLTARYEELRMSLNELNKSFTIVKNHYENLTTNYIHWYYYSMGVITLTNSTIERVFSKSEYLYLRNLLVEQVIPPGNIDWWKALQEIYSYISNEIDYVKDEPIPLPPKLDELLNGTYQNKTFENSIMTPSDTIRLKQGDCDDQAILLYAMIDVYEKYFMGGDTLEWIALLRFKDGSWHMAVLIPIQNKKLTIVDPAGQYYTNIEEGKIGSRYVYDELYTYSSHWSAYGGIEYIELYQVIGNKIYRVAYGGIEDIAKYIIESM